MEVLFFPLFGKKVEKMYQLALLLYTKMFYVVLPSLSGVCPQTLASSLTPHLGPHGPPAVYVGANSDLMFLFHFLLCLSHPAEFLGKFYFLSHSPCFGR